MGKIGVFGGSFDPFHNGHLNSIVSVAQTKNLEKVFVIPSLQSPLKRPTEGPTPEQRVQMVRLGVEGYEDILTVDEQELQRSGPSYTIHTLENYLKSHRSEELYLILGVDAFYELDRWHQAETLLRQTNLIVTSRPGHMFPASQDELPVVVQKLLAEFTYNRVDLTSGLSIEFLNLKDVAASASEIRKRVRAGHSVSKFLSPTVEEYIREHKIYGTLEKRISDFETFTRSCGEILFSKKGIGVRGFDLRNLYGFTDFTLIASGTSTRHTSGLAESVIKYVKEDIGVYPLSVEGISEGRWVLLDYGSLVIHLFYDFVRHEYRLEDLWKDGKDLQLREGNAVSKTLP